MSALVRIFRGHTLCVSVVNECDHGERLKNKICELEGIPPRYVELFHHGRKVADDDVILQGRCYQALLSLPGGKGGFGSMLRMLGAQIDKTTNHDACRDLSGRRLRDVNNEKSLSEWINKKAELEEERKQKRKEKIERLKTEPRHIFVDPKYDKQKIQVIENLNDAVAQGIQASVGTSGSSTASLKRKGDSKERYGKRTASKQWMGVYEDSDSSEDDNEDEMNSNSHEMSKENSDVAMTPDASLESRIVEPNDTPPATIDDTPATIDDTPATNDDTSATIDDTPATIDDTPATIDDTPATIDDAVSVANTSEVPQIEPLDLDKISSVAELETYGLNALKTALMALGMKCGGDLQQRAQRLHSVKGIDPSSIDPRLMAKSRKGKQHRGTKA